MQNLQDLDEKRIKHLANFILKAITAERDVLPIVGQCLDGMEKFTREIDEKEVSLRSDSDCSIPCVAVARFSLTCVPSLGAISAPVKTL